MNTISYPIANSIVLCFDNIKTCGVITTQTFDDSYDTGSHFVKRQLKIASKLCDGQVTTSFEVTETCDDDVAKRICLDDIEAVTVSEGILRISVGAYAVEIGITPIIEFERPVEATTGSVPNIQIVG